ncbi:MAG: glycosyltransferase, partial [Nostoc sp.]
MSKKPTGITTYALNILANLQSLKLTLLTSQSISDYDCYPIPSNLTPDHGTKGHLNRLLWTQFQLQKIYKTLTSCLLFSPLPEAPLYSNCRFVVTSFDMIPLRFGKRFSPLTPYHRYYTPQVLNQAEHIICISQTTAKDITDFYQIPASKITPIPLAHDRTHFYHLNLPTSNYFLYIGRQNPYKNIQRLISAFAALPNCKDYELWLVGPIDSRYTPTLKVQVAELGVTNQIKFLDYVPY